MVHLEGKILKASPALNGSYFQGVRIFITEHNEKGAVGFVTSRLFPRKLNELEEFKTASAIDIYEGGPVDNEHLYFVHSIPSLGGEKISDTFFFLEEILKRP